MYSPWTFVLAAVVALGLVLAIVLAIPQVVLDWRLSETEALLLEAPQRLKAENDIRGTLLQALAGVVLVVGALAAWEQVRLGRREKAIARGGQMADRLGRGAELLGHDEVAVRLGGVHLLAQLLRASSEIDRSAARAVLETYVADRSRRGTNDAPDVDAATQALAKSSAPQRV